MIYEQITQSEHPARRHTTPAEFAAEADVVLDTVYRWIKRGKLPAVKLGRDWRIPTDKAAKILETGFSFD